MKVLIVEDEPIASEHLATQIESCYEDAEITHIFDTVEDTVDFFNSGSSVDLAFFDIELSDGSSFEIFQQADVPNPIVFTTAYDQHTLQAFKVNSIDYLLKPIDTIELKQAFVQYDKFYRQKPSQNGLLKEIYQQLKPTYKQRLLLKLGDHYHSKAIQDISFFLAEGKSTYIYLMNDHKHYITDHTLEGLESKMLDPQKFFRINRKFIINVDAITEIRSYANGRLKLMTTPASPVDMIVSRERVADFKAWLNQ